MGIRTKLIVSLSAILIVLTVVLGTAFSLREQQAIVDLKRDHLRHSAELVSALLPRLEAEDADALISALSDGGSAGRNIRFARRSEHPPPKTISTSAGRTERLSVSVPLSAHADGASHSDEQLVAEEQLPDMSTALLRSLRGHIALGALLTMAAVLAVAVVCQRLVVRPIQWLVAAADSMAQGESWEAIQPRSRSSDEIGVLASHLTELSRRLANAVRSARYSSAHLVAEGVRRDMAEPLRQIALSLAVLEAGSTDDPDARLQAHKIEKQLGALERLAERLRETGVEVQP